MFEVGNAVLCTIPEGTDSDLPAGSYAGVITQVDENDINLPYLVDVEDGDRGTLWFRAENVTLAVANTKELMTKIEAAVATLQSTINEIQGLTPQVRGALETKKTFIPIGVCTQCMEDVQFSPVNGEWPSHGDPSHTPPAIIPRAAVLA